MVVGPNSYRAHGRGGNFVGLGERDWIENGVVALPGGACSPHAVTGKQLYNTRGQAVCASPIAAGSKR